jgi:hypothetical protein
LFGIRKYRLPPVKMVFGEISEISAEKKIPAPNTEANPKTELYGLFSILPSQIDGSSAPKLAPAVIAAAGVRNLSGSNGS